MSDKKNIVIKVKYPNPSKNAAESGQASNAITEWNLKRIALVLGGIVFLGVLIFSVQDAPQQEESKIVPVDSNGVEKTPPKPESVVVNKAQDTGILMAKPEQPVASEIVRSVLTNKIDRNEPGKMLTTPLKISRNDTLGIYYFVELKGMKGKTVFHEWLLNDQLVSRKKVNISSDPWRTASKQAISYTMNNDWQVRLVDESGRLLNEKKFNLDLK